VIERELTCQEFVELVTDYLDGVMPAADRARFEAHLSDCPYCAGFLEKLRLTIRLTGRLSEAALPDEIRNEMLQRFRDWTREPRS
jgi:anti-sigma factor RsiW